MLTILKELLIEDVEFEWSELTCTRKAIKAWLTHNNCLLWYQCDYMKHTECQRMSVTDPDKFIRKVISLDTLINEVSNNSERLEIHDFYSGYTGTLEYFQEEINRIVEDVVECIKTRNMVKYVDIYRNPDALKTKFSSSTLYSDYWKFMNTYYFNERQKYPDRSFYDCYDIRMLGKVSQISEFIHQEITAAKDFEIEEVKRKYYKKKAKLKSKVQCLKEEVEEKDKELKEAQNEISENKNDKKELESLNTKYQASLQTIKTYTESNELLNKSIKSKEIEFKKVKSELENTQKEKTLLEKEIKKLKSENIDLIKDQEESKYEIKMLTEELSIFKDTLAMFDKPNKIYNKITGNDVVFNSEFALNFNLININERRAMNVFKYVQLPPLDNIWIKNANQNDSDVIEFLEKGFPKDTNLAFNCNSKNALKLSDYTAAIVKCLPKIRTGIIIGYCNMNSSDLNSIFPAAKHLDNFIIQWAELKIDEPLDFNSDADYKIKVIWFKEIGIFNFLDFMSMKVNFEAIIEAMAKTKLKTSLEIICIEKFIMKTEFIKETIMNAGFDNVQVKVDH